MMMRDSNKIAKYIVVIVVFVLFIVFLGYKIFYKNYENKKYYMVNSMDNLEIVLPADEDLKNVLYIKIKDEVIYFCRNDEVINFHKIEIIDDKYFFFDGESIKGQIKNNCIEIYYGYTFYFFEEEYIINNN